ncbi:hypothetical protein RhiirB3_453047 [Rhizophagus irregularis]|nr:hypothetical protein RhiirB3_453047 [Rhizophagus irregularis]
MTTIRNYHNQVILRDEDRDMIKAQRNYLIKIGFNEEISYKIIQCNTQLGYDEIDLDSDYKDSEDETPTESENEEDSDKNLSDDDFEREERAMTPIPYPCCNEIHCICYDQIEIDKEYEEYCLNQAEQIAENH